jgi:hypothetical protein
MEEDERVHVHRCGVVVALVVLLAFAGASCGQKTRPEGLIAFSHGVEDDVVVLSLADGRIHRVTSARRGQFDQAGRPTANSWFFPTPGPA